MTCNLGRLKSCWVTRAIMYHFDRVRRFYPDGGLITVTRIYVSGFLTAEDKGRWRNERN